MTSRKQNVKHTRITRTARTATAALGAVSLLVTAAACRDRKSTRLNSSHMPKSRMPSSA